VPNVASRILAALPLSRRIAWRLGRRVYCAARGEPHRNDIAINGEAYVQSCIVRAVDLATPLHVVDIGANQGDWTISLLGILPAERSAKGNVTIDLFEPVPSTVERLQTALASAGEGVHTRVHALALSDRSGQVRLAVMSETGGTNTLHSEGGTIAPPSRWIDIESAMLDDFCAAHAIAHIHLAKCDTEGHDLRVLKGARRMLSESRVDAFQFEYNHRWVFSRSFLKDVFELAADLPYAVARIMPAHIELLPEWHPELERFFEANYLLVRKEALDWFDVTTGRFDVSNTYLADG
jgi:FkbM family methyltransferase